VRASECVSPFSHLLPRREFFRAAAACGIAMAARPLMASAGDDESGYQLGCYTRPWDEFDYRVALDGIAEAGYKYAGIMTAKCKTWVLIHVNSPPEEVAVIAEEVKKRGLRTLSIYGGGFPVSESVEAGIAELTKLIDHSVICGCPNLMLGGTEDEKLVQPYYKVIAECCDYAASKGVGLSIKPHGGQNATGPQCRAMLDLVGNRNFRLWYDPGNIYYYSDGKLDPVDDSKTVDGLVVGMSVKDFKPPKEVLVTPGSGQVDFPKVFANLRNGGFTRGPLIVECLDRGDAAKVTTEAGKVRLFLASLTGQRAD
jgi:sugar phosphate isomerase/epimerase